ncbi:ABC transporter permease [Kineobactrum salinum]|uniref:ABC transporter permease n=1 Tax=Kineobactrum salinum TaxID=2708301 RepID=A0A6C0TXX3_9GAMM|nr:ABC transporter permease [Kineobactrum salinum]QIB64680.1 ABC transporter permease [Kineobactrum salinum]
MNGAWIVFLKEMLDNLRDRRTVLSSFIMGPILGPAIFAVAMTALVTITTGELERPLELPVIGAEHAPGLVAWLRQREVEIQQPPEDPEQAVREGNHQVVLVIPEGYAEEFRAGTPATLQLVVDESNRKAQTNIRRAHNLLDAYSTSVGRLRLLARGVDPRLVDAVAIATIDVASREARAAMILGMLPYLIVISMLMGGFYLAIDTTAGERERGSLEALLTMPLTRSALMTGKLAATFVFSVMALVLALLAFYLVIPRMPLHEIGMAINFSPRMALDILLINLPLALFGAALLTVVAAFTRSFKEAQTWLSLVLLLPMIPTFVILILPFQTELWMMLVPSLSQGALVNEIIRGESLGLLHFAVSALTTLGYGLGLGALAARLYGREAMLG